MLETAGIGLRAPYGPTLLNRPVETGFLEAHSENYFGESPSRHQLRALSERYPISLHGVSASLGRMDGLDADHLNQLKSLVDEIQPVLVSEHLAWSGYQHRHVPDLLPLPYTHNALHQFCAHVDQFQNRLKRRVLIENPANYLVFRHLDMSEPDFLNELARRTGCGILLDVNNLYVSSRNVDLDPTTYLDQLNPKAVSQYHLAGHVERERDGEPVLIDSHNQPVPDSVWSLYRDCLRRFGSRPTLVEWDSDFPPLDVLLDQGRQATHWMEASAHDAA